MLSHLAHVRHIAVTVGRDWSRRVAGHDAVSVRGRVRDISGHPLFTLGQRDDNVRANRARGVVRLVVVEQSCK